MKFIAGALALALLMGCSHKRQPLDNRDPCLDFGAPHSAGFDACLERRAKALKAVLDDSPGKHYEFVSEQQVDP